MAVDEGGGGGGDRWDEQDNPAKILTASNWTKNVQ
jgi:hypothetical protein